MAAQTPPPIMAACIFVIPVQPERKKPSAANASRLFLFISASQQGFRKFSAKVVHDPGEVKQKN
jgi:hypothetical protein